LLGCGIKYLKNIYFTGNIGDMNKLIFIGENPFTKSLAVGPNTIKLSDTGMLVSKREDEEVAKVAALPAKKGRFDITKNTLDHPSEVVKFIRRRKAEEIGRK